MGSKASGHGWIPPRTKKGGYFKTVGKRAGGSKSPKLQFEGLWKCCIEHNVTEKSRSKTFRKKTPDSVSDKIRAAKRNGKLRRKDCSTGKGIWQTRKETVSGKRNHRQELI